MMTASGILNKLHNLLQQVLLEAKAALVLILQAKKSCSL